MGIKGLGTGCANCKATIALIEQVAKAKGASVTPAKVEQLREIIGCGVPGPDKIEPWFVAA